METQCGAFRSDSRFDSPHEEGCGHVPLVTLYGTHSCPRLAAKSRAPDQAAPPSQAFPKVKVPVLMFYGLNDQALKDGGRLLSVYGTGERRFWIITESDRSATTVLMPDDY